jgi:predicted phosphoadenosine phosphosulfate sulfurtransferase
VARRARVAKSAFGPRRLLGIDVLEAARQRIAWTFDSFERVCVSFSGGKDSSVMLHLVMEAAIARGRRVAVLFLDWEAQFRLTIEHVTEMFDRYRDHIDPFWVALPLTTTNAVSMHEPEWTCWDPAKRALWVREPPKRAITDPAKLPFHYPKITFEQFIEKFGRWYSADASTASLVGIRTTESLHRWRAISKARKSRLEGKAWTAWKGEGLFNVYPLYDWQTADIWTYFGRTKLPYNRLYDRMHQAGVPLAHMRICEPYGDEQRRGLWLFHAVEPETWGRVCARVAGANSGALYAGERGNILGNQRIDLPPGHTWQSFARFLLETMPSTTAEHYRDKIAVYLRYCEAKLGMGPLPDAAPGDTGGKDVASWRRICRTLLRNDYWCSGLSFSPTKPEHFQRYRKLMKQRRTTWGYE